MKRKDIPANAEWRMAVSFGFPSRVISYGLSPVSSQRRDRIINSVTPQSVLGINLNVGIDTPTFIRGFTVLLRNGLRSPRNRYWIIIAE